VVAIVVSAALVVAGLYLAAGQPDTGIATIGSMLMVLGAIFLSVNLYLRVKGYRMPRRRRR
jgi:hypothetical protein